MKSRKNQLKHIALAILQIVLFSALTGKVKAQSNTPPPLHPKLEALARPLSTPNWLDFREGTVINPATIFSELKDAFELKADDQMKIIKTEKDKIGFTHFRYQQFYKNLKVVYGEYALHQQPDGFVKSGNGRLIKGLTGGNFPLYNQKRALDAALQFMNAGKYLWQNAAMEKELKRQENNPNATYYPKGELVFAPSGNDANFLSSPYKLAWQFEIYPDNAEVPAKLVYVDALTGRVIHHSDISMRCSTGSGNTAFNGNRSIKTDAAIFNLFYQSHNDCQATDIYVYNCDRGDAKNDLYIDNDNVWTDRSAVQAQWGGMKVYDYYNGIHSRQSWNGSSGDMIVYNNSNRPGLGLNNACWGCTGSSAIFGAGSTTSATDDWNTLDIMGHEFTHGVVRDEAGLVYSYESGALNESFADIFGEMTESAAVGINDYLVGADRGAIRSFKNPNTYGDPDTYKGTNWAFGSGDNGGVHTNSGVQNHWFYLLSEGGSGTNDRGESYNVTGINRFKARDIAYRALTLYLNSTSQYIDSRAATLRAARDLYGGCSTEEIAVGNAWHAVGVESLSDQYVNAVPCGTYSSGQFFQAISRLETTTGCATTVNSAVNTVTFTARDQVVLRPGFRAVAGSKFRAYLEPCSVTMRRGSESDVMSDAEKGINTAPIEVTPPVEPVPLTLGKQGISITPNPFHSTFDVSINSKENMKGTVNVFNSLGEKVKVIPEINVVKGLNKISLNGASFRSGVYMVEINVGNVKTVKKIVKL